jgi:hypothetical protein
MDRRSRIAFYAAVAIALILFVLAVLASDQAAVTLSAQ